MRAAQHTTSRCILSLSSARFVLRDTGASDLGVDRLDMAAPRLTKIGVGVL